MNNLGTSFDTNVCTHTVREILKFNYKIPTYQRRYRWNSSGSYSSQQLGLQVDDLIRDIKEYSELSEKDRDEFYYLQPIVVAAKSENDFQLIDGQQRLTTLRILLKSLVKIDPNLNLKISFGTVEYEDKNREKIIELNKLLEESSDVDECKSKNIDEYYVREAIKTAISAFEKFKDSEKRNFAETLLDKTRVIWYQVPCEDGNKLFTRLNTGKIPLTNAELIKALILRKRNFENDRDLLQIKIATEWDCIESDLHDEKLWYFIPHKSSNYSSRLDAIFDLYCQIEIQRPNSSQEDPLYTFNKFALKIKEGKDPIELWNDIRAFFLKLKEWSNNPRKHGLIGFVLHGLKDKSILGEDKNFDFIDWMGKNKKEFLDNLSESYSKDLNFDDRQGVKSFLLLANICACIKDNTFFPFKEYITNPPDVEHIASFTDNNMEKDKDKENFLKSISNIWEKFRKNLEDLFGKDNGILTSENITEIDKYFPIENDYNANAKSISIKELSKKENSEDFKACYDTISKHPILGEYVKNLSEESKNEIGNLALLDKVINRGYGNALFIEKQKTIVETKEYIYPVTKNAFIRNFELENDSQSNVDSINRSNRDIIWNDTDVESNREYMVRLIKNELFKKD